MASTAAATDGGILSHTMVKNLSDGNTSIRKKGAQEIDVQVKTLRAARDFGTLSQLNKQLCMKFTRSIQPSQRKGGLLALATVALALGDDLLVCLHELITPIVECFTDQESTVRYHACEALFNVAKVARKHSLAFFSQIFEGIVKLIADSDHKVQSAAHQLDQLIKDIACEEEEFNLKGFVTLAETHIKSLNPHVRSLMVKWLAALDQVPDLDLIPYLPNILRGLFLMLSDRRAEIVSETESLLREFQREVAREADHEVEAGPLLKILFDNCASKDERTRLAAVRWCHDWASHGNPAVRVLPFAADFVRAIVPCLADVEEAVRKDANHANFILTGILKDNAINSEEVSRDILQSLLGMLDCPEALTRTAVLSWLLMLTEQSFELVLSRFDELLPVLTKTLGDPCSTEDVQRLDLAILARMAKPGKNFQPVMRALVHYFKTETSELTTRSSVIHIIRQLSQMLSPQQVFCELAAMLEEDGDGPFVQSMVQLLSMILLTSPEAQELRTLLQGGLGHPNSCKFFLSLYRCWVHCAVSALSLCLLAGAYEPAYSIVRSMGKKEVTVALLTQLDKLVQLLESRIFVHLRLDLLEPQRHPYLVKALFGLLMVLPQSSAHELLRNRLQCVTTLSLTNLAMQKSLLDGDSPLSSPAQDGIPPERSSNPTEDIRGGSGSGDFPTVDWNKLLEHFNEIQQRV